MKEQYVRSLWKSTLLILVLNGLFVAYLLIKPGSPQQVNTVDNVVQGLLEGVGLLLTLPLFLQGIGRAGRLPVSFAERVVAGRSGQRWVPFLLSLAILSYVIGQVLWTYNEDLVHLPVLFPSWADAGYLGSYPFVLLALLLLPSRPLPADTRTRIVLDSLMIMVGVTTFSWYFVLGPTILQAADTVLGRVIGTAYPLMTLVLIFCLLLLVIHSHDRTIRPVALILGVAFVIIVTTDSIYNYQELHNAYATGGWLDVGWPLGYMLVGLGARALRMVIACRSLSADTPFSASLPEGEADKSGELGRPSKAGKPFPASFVWQSLLPYLFIPVVILLLAYTILATGSTLLKMGVFLGTALLIGLLVLRQIFAIRETISQTQKLWELHERTAKAELAHERAQRLRVERILALNQVLTASQQSSPHARILAFGHYQVRDGQGGYYNVYYREGEESEAFECECPHYQQQGICPHSLTAAALHSVSGTPHF